jgi:eukaryotic-like serine/threonine-protein kinase
MLIESAYRVLQIFVPPTFRARMTQQPPTITPNQQIGKYRLAKLLGKGTSGTVYHARDTVSGNEVALKIINPAVFRDPEFGAERYAQFLAEASLAGMLIHPHIVSILDAAAQDETGYIAMELVTGGDLSRHVEPGTLLPVSDVMEIAFNCCSALEYTSRVGIIHCDIKPANIMIAEGTDVRITDFGAAFLRKSQVVRTAAMGSPHYMSPEQIAGKELTLRSDMYSLGVVLYEMLTGRQPFVSDNLDDLVRRILTMAPAPPSRVRPGLSRQIDGAVLRALQKKPERRYESWNEFALELSEISRHVASPEVVAESEKLNALRRVEAFATLSEAELREISKAARWTRAKATEIVVREDDPGTHFYLLASGSAKVMRRERLLNLIKEGEFFGEMAYILGKQQRHATVVATNDILLAEFKPDSLARISLGAQLQLTRSLARNLVERLALANTRLTG